MIMSFCHTWYRPLLLIPEVVLQLLGVHSRPLDGVGCFRPRLRHARCSVKRPHSFRQWSSAGGEQPCNQDVHFYQTGLVGAMVQGSNEIILL